MIPPPQELSEIVTAFYLLVNQALAILKVRQDAQTEGAIMNPQAGLTDEVGVSVGDVKVVDQLALPQRFDGDNRRGLDFCVTSLES